MRLTRASAALAVAAALLVGGAAVATAAPAVSYPIISSGTLGGSCGSYDWTGTQAGSSTAAVRRQKARLTAQVRLRDVAPSSSWDVEVRVTPCATGTPDSTVATLSTNKKGKASKTIRVDLHDVDGFVAGGAVVEVICTPTAGTGTAMWAVANFS